MSEQRKHTDPTSLKAVMVDSLVGNDYSLCLCAGLHEVGQDIGLVTVENRESPFSIGYPLYRWAPPKEGGGKIGKLLQYIGYLRRLYRFSASNKKSQVLHFQFFRRERIESFYIALLKMMGMRVVYTAHNIVPHEAAWIDRWLKAMVYRSAHAIIVHSNFVKKALLEIFPMPAEKIRVIPHGNFDHYLPDTLISKEEARGKLGLKKQDKVLLFFGYIREYKGLDLLLDAFVIAAAKDPDLKLVIAGSPHTKAMGEAAKTLIEQSGLADRVVFHGRFIPHEDIEQYFVASDLVMLPYKHIYHSGIVHLAYSYGRPSLATNVGDFSETIEEGKSGFILEKNTADALAEKILKVMLDPEKLCEMGRYAKSLSSTRYSWLDIGQKTRQVYQEVAS